MAECNNSNVVTDLLEGLAIEQRQLELLQSVGEVSATPTPNTILDRLKSIYEAVDGLEISLDEVNLNTDQVEQLITLTNQAIANLQTSNETHSDEEQQLLSDLKNLVTAFNLAFDNRDLAKDSTLLAFKAEAKAEADETQALIGEVQETPTPNTLLARVKEINDTLLSQDVPSRKDENNSTNTPLTVAGSNFVGQWTKTNNISTISFFAFSDQPFDVARIEWSSDGVNVNSDLLATADFMLSQEDVDGFFVYYPDPQTYLLDAYFRVVLEKNTGTDQSIMSSYLWTFSNGAQPFSFIDPEGVPSTLSKALLTKNINPALVIAQYTDEENGVLPSGTNPVIDPVLNTEPNTLDTGWISTESFAGKNIINAVTNQEVDIYLMNASDDQGANIFGDAAPTLTSLQGSARQLSALYADNFFRMVIVNRSGFTLDNYSIRVTAAPESTDGITTSIDADIFGFFPAKITRSVGAGKNPDGKIINLEAPGFYSSQITSTPRLSGVEHAPVKWAAVNGYGSHQFAIFGNKALVEDFYTDAAGSTGSVLIEVSEDGVTKTTDFVLELGTNPPAEFAIFTIAFPFFRIRVAPPTTDEAFFITNVVAYGGAPTPPIRSIDSKFTGRGLAVTTRSVFFGRPEGSASTDPFEAVQTDGKGRILTNGGSRFTRLLNRQVEDNEELRADVEPTSKLSRIVNDGVITAGSSTFTSATANFTDTDFHAFVTATGLPSNSYIIDVVSPTEVVLNQNALVSNTGVTADINKAVNILASAPLNTAMSSAVWRMVLIELSPTRNPERFRYRENVAYTERYDGW